MAAGGFIGGYGICAARRSGTGGRILAPTDNDTYVGRSEEAMGTAQGDHREAGCRSACGLRRRLPVSGGQGQCAARQAGGYGLADGHDKASAGAVSAENQQAPLFLRGSGRIGYLGGDGG